MTETTLRQYVGHLPACSTFRCRHGHGCDLPLDHDLHYTGTVDSHAYVPGLCDCRREFVIAQLMSALALADGGL